MDLRLSKALKSGLVSLFRRSGLASVLRGRLGGAGVILVLHEIHDDLACELMTGCSPSLLAALVNGLRRDGWDIVGLDAALRRIAHGVAATPFAVLTFDDGYRDTLSRALPVLERLEAPFTVYVPTGAVTRELYAWWLALRALFRSHHEVAVECMDRRFECSDLAGKIAALKAAAGWVHQDYHRKFALAPTFAAYGISPAALAQKYFLDCDELRALARHPLVTIGAHTTSHPALSTLEPGQARCEMVDNKVYLQRLLDQDITHFAYPYGDPRACGAREAEIARELGFVSAVTAEASPIYPEHRHRMHRLPRVAVRPDETAETLYYRASGLSWAMNAHKRRRLANA
jgi:peptidoglycan/xylan/chitin deacetylase (PgdA/CDA1 family)